MIELTRDELELIKDVIVFEDRSYHPSEGPYFEHRNIKAQLLWGKELNDIIPAVKSGEFDIK